jgi:hypothetical protein
MIKYKQPWLGNATQESIFILAPALVPVAIVFLFRNYFSTHQVDTLWWIILVLCIDVSHVYSTLFRLYWDRPTLMKYKRTLIVIPVVSFTIALTLHYYDALIFWRVLAYVAVFHFVRQQFGFMRLYSRHEHASKVHRYIDELAIYSATLYPLLYWHLHATNSLSWFVKGDFIKFDFAYESIVFVAYLIILFVYVIKEGINIVKLGTINIPKTFIVIGTYASWYVGIVTFQGDLIFTLLNVVAHGIPYMALIWIHGKKKSTQTNFSFNLRGTLLFMGILFMLAYVEENFWDGIIWKDHPDIFPMLAEVSLNNPVIISMIVSLLVLPQITHYVLDGFIWRFSKDVQARIE